MDSDTINIISIGDYKDVFLSEIKDINYRDISMALLNVSSAYWNNDSANKSLTRINGIAFNSLKELEDYKFKIEEAKQRDHRKLGKELGLFMFDDVAQGMPFWLPNGVIVYDKLVEFWKKLHKKNGYQEIKTPMTFIIGDREVATETVSYRNFGDKNMYVEPKAKVVEMVKKKSINPAYYFNNNK